MKEQGSCVHPFIKRVQHVLSKEGTLKDCLAEIAPYQSRVALVYNVNVYWPHAVVVSRFGLASLVLYEVWRSQSKLPLPDSKSIINKIVPVNARSEQIIFKESPNDARHEKMAQEIEKSAA